jgi:hypothetical protein
LNNNMNNNNNNNNKQATEMFVRIKEVGTQAIQDLKRRRTTAPKTAATNDDNNDNDVVDEEGITGGVSGNDIITEPHEHVSYLLLLFSDLFFVRNKCIGFAHFTFKMFHVPTIYTGRFVWYQ